MKRINYLATIIAADKTGVIKVNDTEKEILEYLLQQERGLWIHPQKIADKLNKKNSYITERIRGFIHSQTAIGITFIRRKNIDKVLHIQLDFNIQQITF